MIAILLLKQIHGLSDEGVWERWVHDPYFQHFTGETFFQYKVPHERSGLSHWRGAWARSWSCSWPRACAWPMPPAP